MSIKTIIIIGSTIVFILFSIVLFFYLSITYSKDCDQFVIDSYELASGIDIPEISNARCFFNEDTNIRISIYTIDTNQTNLNSFLQQYNFVKTDSAIENTMWSSSFLKMNNVALKDSLKDLYLAGGVDDGSIWQCLLDKKTATMLFEIEWK